MPQFLTNPHLIQAIGFVGVALFIVSYQIKSNRALFFCQMMGCIVFCVQFFLITKYSPPQSGGRRAFARQIACKARN